MSTSLPSTWVYVRLDQTAIVVAGNPAPQGSEYFQNGKFNLVRVHDMGVNGNNTFLTKTRDQINDKAAVNMRLISSNSVLFTKSGASTLLNQRAILAKDSYVVSHIAAALPFNGVESKWLFYFLQLVDFSTLAHATNMPSLPLSRAKAIRVPLAPMNEQTRIVAKIEELFSELDKGVESLKTARAKLNVYRQTVLKHAFEGKLTAQWREENKYKLETPEQLLARIKQERAARYQRQLQEWKASSAEWHKGGQQGQKPKKPLKPKTLPPLTSANLTGLPILPSCWRWVRIGEIVLVGTGVTPLKSKPEYYVDGDVAWVTSGALNNPFVSCPTGYVTETALNDTNLRVYPPHTLLVALYGEGKTRGKCSELLIEATINQAIAALVQEGTAEYLRGLLKWFLMKNYDEVRTGSSGGVQPNLNLGIIENSPVPICSIAEAEEIGRQIKRKFSQAVELEEELVVCLRQSEIFRQSILKKAFAGQLVPQDPNDEPASELLKRITEEKARRDDAVKAATKKAPPKESKIRHNKILISK